MIKKYILGLGITLLGLISFSNAGLIPNQLTKVSSEVDSNYKIAFLNKGQIITEYLGTSKPIIALSNNVLFWWGTNGLPYTYSPLGQGFFDSFYSCAEFTGDVTSPTNCTAQTLNSSSAEILKNFFNKVSIGDYSYYNYSAPYQGGVNCSSRNGGIELCWSSHEIGNSICFKNVYCSNGCQNGTYACQNFCNGWGGCGGSFINSQNLPSSTSFGSISNNWIGQAPGILNNSFESGSGSFNSTGDTLNVDSDVDTIIKFFESRYGFTENLCRVGSDNFSVPYGSGNVCDSSISSPSGNSNFDIVCNHIDGTDYDYSCSPMLTYVNGSCDLQFSLTSDCGSSTLNYCDENNNCYESYLPDGVGTTYNLSDYTTSLSCSSVSNISIGHMCGNGSQNIFSFVGSSDNGNSGVCTGSFNFEIGKGGSIFSLYRNFYSGGNLKDVGTFINLWQLNYNQWFNVRNSDAVVFDNAEFYLADWNGPGTNVKVRYDNITFPFAGKPAVLYFMTDYIYTNTPEFQMGDEIASYCYAKLNRDNIKNGSVSFGDYYNSIPGYVQGNISSYTNYSFKPSEGYSVPSSSGGESNMWNYVISTGNSIPSDLDPTELFKGFYNRITSLVSNYNPNSNGIVPLRIVYPMIFLILFRILRH